jgi:uncharacterized Fe-S cluster-containing radical SAM superfamily protein
MNSLVDPIVMGERIAKIVSSGNKRKYYRFRPAPFYGGIATADCVGCCLKCLFCWSWNIIVQPEKVGRFYSPQEVVRKLLFIVKKKGLRQVRVSGNEPTLHRSHLLQVLEVIPKEIHFILETNGILIGDDSSYARDLSRFPNLYVRVSLKGACREEFSRLTGTRPEGFTLQLKALENLLEEGVDCFPAVMAHFSSPGEIEQLRRMLKGIRPDFADFEEEELILYPFVMDHLQRAGLKWTGGCTPD